MVDKNETSTNESATNESATNESATNESATNESATNGSAPATGAGASPLFQAAAGTGRRRQEAGATPGNSIDGSTGTT